MKSLARGDLGHASLGIDGGAWRSACRLINSSSSDGALPTGAVVGFSAPTPAARSSNMDRLAEIDASQGALA
jgi:hypothetical protein